MCGIIAVIGKYRYDEIPSALIERGPDQGGIYQDEFVQLIQTRLEITPCKIELPFQTDEFVLLFNGEVYNWKEFDGENEYESILKAYKKYRNRLGNYLDGQYLIIVYNKYTKDISFFQDDFKIHTAYETGFEASKIYASNLRSLPQLTFNKLQHKGFGNITTAKVL